MGPVIGMGRAGPSVGDPRQIGLILANEDASPDGVDGEGNS